MHPPFDLISPLLASPLFSPPGRVVCKDGPLGLGNRSTGKLSTLFFARFQPWAFSMVTPWEETGEDAQPLLFEHAEYTAL